MPIEHELAYVFTELDLIWVQIHFKGISKQADPEFPMVFEQSLEVVEVFQIVYKIQS